MDIKKAIGKVIDRKNLSEKEMKMVFAEIMTGKATPAQIGSFVTALRMKGETVEEITGAAKVMREKAVKIKVTSPEFKVIDTCGTGGTGTKTFNISTTVAFVLAGCGVKVAKHGNRAVSSHCGSADVLEELGVKIKVSSKLTQKCINDIGVGFLFAPLYHGAMRHAIGPRRDMGIRTIFNILGPLSNPASTGYQILGVYDESLTEVMAKVLKNLGLKRAYVVSGAGPLDEVSITGKTRVSELSGGTIRTYDVFPGYFGMKRGTLSSIKGGTVKQNAKMLRQVLAGKKGAPRDIVLMNSSMALMATGTVKNFKQGIRLASESVDLGKAQEKLDKLISITNSHI